MRKNSKYPARVRAAETIIMKVKRSSSRLRVNALLGRCRTSDPASDLSTVVVTMNDDVCVLHKLFSEIN